MEVKQHPIKLAESIATVYWAIFCNSGLRKMVFQFHHHNRVDDGREKIPRKGLIYSAEYNRAEE